MLMGDVITLIQHQLPIKIIIFNNGALGFVELEMKAAGMLEYGTELKNPNFAELAKSMGIYGVRIEDSTKLVDGLMAAFAHDGPAIIDVVVNRTELIVPPAIAAEQVKGLGLFMIKAIMSGKGDEVFDLIKTNLWR
jgi:pyruvate dehydrogenase (quinone)